MLIEDLSPNVIETLGSALDIDPFFFASQIDILKPEIGIVRPETATLPSRSKSQNSLHFDYHRVTEFEGVKRRALIQDANVPRKVKVLAPIQGVDTGLARHCCSILQTVGKDGLWLGKVTRGGGGIYPKAIMRRVETNA